MNKVININKAYSLCLSGELIKGEGVRVTRPRWAWGGTIPVHTSGESRHLHQRTGSVSRCVGWLCYCCYGFAGLRLTRALSLDGPASPFPQLTANSSYNLGKTSTKPCLHRSHTPHQGLIILNVSQEQNYPVPSCPASLLRLLPVFW